MTLVDPQERQRKLPADILKTLARKTRRQDKCYMELENANQTSLFVSRICPLTLLQRKLSASRDETETSPKYVRAETKAQLSVPLC